jgi:hypothetical protein
MRLILFILGTNRTPLSCLSVLLICLAILGGCGRAAVQMTLEGFSKGTVYLDVNPSGYEVALYLFPEEGFPDCPVVGRNVIATLNGNSSFNSGRGGLDTRDGEPSCNLIAFGFTKESLLGPGTPHGEIVLQDETHTIRFTVSNLAAERKLTLLTPVAGLKPGSQVRLSWEPVTDSVIEGNGGVNGRGLYSYTFLARVESEIIIAELPNEPWPAGAELYVNAFASTGVIKCEGIMKCQLLPIGKQQRIELPTL